MTAIPYTLLVALMMVESGGDDRAVGKSGELGCLQISPIALKDVERITNRPLQKDDCFDRPMAFRIAMVYISHYATEERIGRTPTPRDMALIWRHGPNGWARGESDPYWQKVKKHFHEN